MFPDNTNRSPIRAGIKTIVIINQNGIESAMFSIKNVIHINTYVRSFDKIKQEPA